jgi:hypothetical protein
MMTEHTRLTPSSFEKNAITESLTSNLKNLKSSVSDLKIISQMAVNKAQLSVPDRRIDFQVTATCKPIRTSKATRVGT